MPAEWQIKQRTFIEWPVREMIWGNNMHQAQLAYANVANKISEFEPVTLIVNARSAALARKMCSNRIEFMLIKHDDSWFRDNGPTFVVNNHDLAGICWKFNAWGEKYTPFDQDKIVAQQLLDQLKIKKYQAHIVLEGGSIHVDGQGTLLTTRECLLNPNRNPNITSQEIEDTLKNYLGIKQIIWLNKGLWGDETDGHIDNVACFTDVGKIVMQSCYTENDPNYLIFKENQNILKNSLDARGKKLEIVEIEQPPPRYLHNKRLTLSYINYYLVNDGVILPVFGTEATKYDKNAESILAEIYPKRKIVPLDGSIIIQGGGNFHCITQQMPKI